MITAKDFRALAGALAGTRALASPFIDDPQHDGYADGVLDATEMMAATIAVYCASSNHRFDRERFMRECGIDVEHLAVPATP
jgi:hypothetical protein